MLNKPAKNAVVATYTITADSATATDDYTPPNPLTVSIPSGATEGTISIPIVSDTIYEGDETFTVNVTGATNVSNTTPNLSVAVTIVDDEDESTLTGPTTAVSVTETDSGTNDSATFNVSLSPASKDPVTLIYNTMVGSASTSDFTTITNDPEVTIAAGQTQLASDISITVLGDDLQEGDEEFFVVITIKNDSTTKAKIDSTSAQLVVPITITDNDTTNPTVQLKASADQDTPTEASGSGFAVKFDLTSTTTGIVSVDYAITATGSNPIDLADDIGTIASGTAAIRSGTEGTIAIPIIDDNIDEVGETFTVTLSNPSDNATLGGRMSQEFTITDNDDTPVLSLDSTTSTINEGGRYC